MLLGNYVRNERKNMGLSQKEFGKYIGVSYVSISNLEKNHRCGLLILRKLSKYLNISIEELRSMTVDEYFNKAVYVDEDN